MRLANKIALVTGSARGIGRAAAALFHSEGAVVIVSDIRDDEGRHLVRELKTNAEYHHLDAGSEEDWQQVAAHIRDKYGRLDILINNAGITGFLETPGPWDAEHADLKS